MFICYSFQVVKNRYDGTVGKMDLHYNRSRMSFRPSARILEEISPSEAVD